MVKVNDESIALGIIGAGRIASRFVTEALCVKGIRIEAAFNPRLESARRFACDYNINRATDSLSELFEHVDAVYIASPHRTHFEYIDAALNAQKHVFCEKPMTLNGHEAEIAFLRAENSGLVLMEGIKTAYCPGFIKLLEIIQEGSIGSVKDIEACFTKLVPQKGSREWIGKDAGAFYELASYPLYAIAKISGTQCGRLRFNSLFNADGVDYYSKAYLNYQSGFASLKVGIGVKSEGELIVSGTDGYIVVQAPWWKTRRFEIRYEDATRIKAFDCEFLGEGLRYELRRFVDEIKAPIASREYPGRRESLFLADAMERFGSYKAAALCGSNGD